MKLTMKPLKRPKALWTQLPSYMAKQANKTSPKPSWKQRKPIRKRSKSMARKMVVYREKRDEFLRAKVWCEVCFDNKATEVHHSKGRGKYLLDVSTFIAMCRTCHQFCHQNVGWAYAKGYMLKRD